MFRKELGMATRIQELLLRFNTPPSNEAAINYLTKYVDKGELRKIRATY